LSTRPESVRRQVKQVPDGFPRRSSLDASVHFVAQTFLVRSASSQIASPGVGILSIAAYRPGSTPLVLLADLQSLNKGASLTNAAATAINFVAHTALRDALGADHATAAWVELDSEGCFDVMNALWPMNTPWRPQRPEPPHVSWAPLRHDGRARTLDAFLAKFPSLAPTVWHEASIALNDLRSSPLGVANSRDGD
jgi:hypothetical protein